MAAVRSQVALVMLVVLMTTCWLVQARYLPTRADGSRKEQIKELLRALLEISPEDRDFARTNYPYDFHGAASVVKRSVRERTEPISSYQAETE